MREYLDSRYLSACEAMWRIFVYHIHHWKPAVQKLIIHLPGEQNITYRATDDLSRVLAREDIERTMLTAWMKKKRRV